MKMNNFLPEFILPSLDPLYNHKTTCEFLVYKGISHAVTNFRMQSQCLKTVDPQYLCELRCIFLNSLNRCLYNYILFTWDISLSACCFQNKALTHQFDSHEDFLNAGELIMKRYASFLNFQPTTAVHIAKACSYIEEHLNENLTLAIVASHIFVSSCYLCKIFKPFTGKTFCNYVSQLRLIRAKNLLLTTNYPIDQIAASCGFSSPSYFSTAFRKQSGLAPIEFRNKYVAAQPSGIGSG